MAVNVRFVPRNTSTSLSFAELAFVPPRQAADMVEPSKREMDKSRAALAQGGIGTDATPLNRLVTTMSEDDFQQMFRTKLVRKSTSPSSETRSIAQNESYLQPVDVLPVPDALSDSIAFAYVPRPVEYHASQPVPQPLPPKEDIYHLRLGDVAVALNATRCHQKGLAGKGVKVAMADSGFWLHPYLIRSGYNLLPTQSPGSGPADQDASGHGTGEVSNIFAIAPLSTVYGVKHGSSAAGTLETCIDQGPAVMSNSWGWDIDNQSRVDLQSSDPSMYAELIDLESVIRRATERNICVLFSAGNGHLSFPACLPEVIAVGGVTWNEDGSLVASSYASGFVSQLYPDRRVPDVCGLVGESSAAPMKAHIMLPVPVGSRLDGENFPSGRRNLGWGIFSGTSAACPQVAGLVALIKQINGSLNTSQIRNVLAARAIDITAGQTATGETATDGPDVATGAGLVDALRACGYVEGQ